MKPTAIVLFAALAVLVPLPRLASQQFQVTSSDAVLIDLPGGRIAVLKAQGSVVVVAGVLGNEQAGAAAVDVAVGDRVASFQGGAIASLAAITAGYAAVEVGATVSLGLTRGSKAEHVVRFPKQTAPAGRMAVATADGGTGAWVAGGGPSDVQEMVIAGVHVRNNDQGMPAVTHRTSHPAGATVSLRVGDVIEAFNGQRLSALAGLELFYQRTKPGETVRLTVLRDGNRTTVTFPRPPQ